MFNDERNKTYGVSVDDPIETTLTTKGYLSDGCRADRALSINGGKSEFVKGLFLSKLAMFM